LFKKPVRTEVLKNFAAHIIVDTWNNLPEEVINAETTEKFKRLLGAMPMAKTAI